MLGERDLQRRAGVPIEAVREAQGVGPARRCGITRQRSLSVLCCWLKRRPRPVDTSKRYRRQERQCSDGQCGRSRAEHTLAFGRLGRRAGSRGQRKRRLERSVKRMREARRSLREQRRVLRQRALRSGHLRGGLREQRRLPERVLLQAELGHVGLRSREPVSSSRRTRLRPRRRRLFPQRVLRRSAVLPRLLRGSMRG